MSDQQPEPINGETGTVWHRVGRFQHVRRRPSRSQPRLRSRQPRIAPEQEETSPPKAEAPKAEATKLEAAEVEARQG